MGSAKLLVRVAKINRHEMMLAVVDVPERRMLT